MTADLAPVLRSEVEVAADAVWSLFDARLVPRTPEMLKACAKAAGLRVDDLRLASVRRERVAKHRLIPAPVKTRPGPPPAEAVSPTRTTFVRQRHFTEAGRKRVAERAFKALKEPERLHCTVCGLAIEGAMVITSARHRDCHA